MRTLIVSDIHGNLLSLEALVNLGEVADQWICLGDNVNYGPWGNECVELIASLPNCQCLMGNHEQFYLGGAYGGTSEVGRAFFQHCFEGFNQTALIQAYAQSCQLDSFLCQHTLEDRYLFHDSPIDLVQDCMIGHSHQQYLVERGGFRLLNPGSLGQDRKYINRANYAIYESSSGKIELKSFLFDVGIVYREMKRKKYPQICLDYYQGKKQL